MRKEEKDEEAEEEEVRGRGTLQISYFDKASTFTNMLI